MTSNDATPERAGPTGDPGPDPATRELAADVPATADGTTTTEVPTSGPEAPVPTSLAAPTGTPAGPEAPATDPGSAATPGPSGSTSPAGSSPMPGPAQGPTPGWAPDGPATGPAGAPGGDRPGWTGTPPAGPAESPSGDGAGWSGAPTAGPSPVLGTVGAELKALRRSRGNRVIAGVAGGIAQRLGIDPLVVRVLIVVLALFGGAGVLLYAVGWLLIPDEATGSSVLDQSFGSRRDGKTSSLLLAVGLGLLAVATAVTLLGNAFDGALLLALALLVAAFLLRRREDRPGVAGAAPGYVAEPAWSSSYAPGQPAWSTDTPLATAAPAGSGAGTTSGTTSGTTPGTTWSGYAGSSGTPLPPPPLGDPWPTPAPPPPRRPRSVLFPLTLSAVLVVLGIVGMVDVAGASVPGATYFAWALATVGAGLLVGTWFGRSRGLIFVGFLLAGGLAIAAAAHHWEADWDGEARTVRHAPTSAEQVEAIDSEYRAGSITYDLSDVDFAGQDVQMAVDLGAGELTVVVPDDVAVVVNSEVGAGDAEILGETRDGLGVTFDHTEPGEPDAGTLTLDLTVGLGTLEVSRAQA